MTKSQLSYTFLICLLVSFGIYGRSLPYSFTYDDHTKIVQNPGLSSFSKALSSFWDRDTQSKDPVLNTHTYRPLLYLDFYIDKAMWGLKPAAFRFENLLLHALNATLVVILAVEIFSVGWFAGLIGGLLFLLHPVQIESVVWIVERSNLLCSFLILLALNSWFLFLRHGKKAEVVLSSLFFVMGLMIRENAAVFPILAVALNLLWNQRHNRSAKHLRWSWLVSFFVINIAYLLWRAHVLGAVSQAHFYGGTWWTNLFSATRVWLYAVRFLIVPEPLTINHVMSDLTTYNTPIFYLSIMAALSLIVLTVLALARYPRWGFCLVCLLAFWFPTSQVIPLSKPFAERFLYQVLIAVGWLAALSFDRLRKIRKGIPDAFIFIVALYAGVTFVNVPTWRDDITLWTRAASLNPTYWQNWYHLAESEKIMAWTHTHLLGQPEPAGWKDRAENYYLTALKCGFPSDWGAIVFLNLAEINLMQGKFREAEMHAQRGLSLRPDFIGIWENRKKMYLPGTK